MPFLIKISGLIFIVTATTLFGIELSLRLRRRAGAINWYIKAVSEIGEKIRYTSAELGVIIGSIYGQEKYLRVDEPFSVSLREVGLDDADKQILTEFFSGLGSGDTEEEIKRCSLYKRTLEKQLSSAEKAADEKSRLYKMLGFFGGIAIAIILI